MYKILFLLLFITFGASADNSIIALVDKDIITTKDLDNRYNFVVKSNNIDLSQQDPNQLKAHILALLINEVLFAQEAKKLSISVTQNEINRVIKRTEESKNLPAGGLFLGSTEQDKKQIITQMTNSILWEKFLFTIIAPQVDITEKELQDYIKMHYKSTKLSKQEMNNIRNEIKFQRIEKQGQQYMQNLKKTKFVQVHEHKLLS